MFEMDTRLKTAQQSISISPNESGIEQSSYGSSSKNSNSSSSFSKSSTLDSRFDEKSSLLDQSNYVNGNNLIQVKNDTLRSESLLSMIGEIDVSSKFTSTENFSISNQKVLSAQFDVKNNYVSLDQRLIKQNTNNSKKVDKSTLLDCKVVDTDLDNRRHNTQKLDKTSTTVSQCNINKTINATASINSNQSASLLKGSCMMPSNDFHPQETDKVKVSSPINAADACYTNNEDIGKHPIYSTSFTSTTSSLNYAKPKQKVAETSLSQQKKYQTNDIVAHPPSNTNSAKKPFLRPIKPEKPDRLCKPTIKGNDKNGNIDEVDKLSLLDKNSGKKVVVGNSNLIQGSRNQSDKLDSSSVFPSDLLNLVNSCSAEPSILISRRGPGKSLLKKPNLSKVKHSKKVSFNQTVIVFCEGVEASREASNESQYLSQLDYLQSLGMLDSTEDFADELNWPVTPPDDSSLDMNINNGSSPINDEHLLDLLNGKQTKLKIERFNGTKKSTNPKESDPKTVNNYDVSNQSLLSNENVEVSSSLNINKKVNNVGKNKHSSMAERSNESQNCIEKASKKQPEISQLILNQKNINSNAVFPESESVDNILMSNNVLQSDKGKSKAPNKAVNIDKPIEVNKNVLLQNQTYISNVSFLPNAQTHVIRRNTDANQKIIHQANDCKISSSCGIQCCQKDTIESQHQSPKLNSNCYICSAIENGTLKSKSDHQQIQASMHISSQQIPVQVANTTSSCNSFQEITINNRPAHVRTVPCRILDVVDQYGNKMKALSILNPNDVKNLNQANRRILIPRENLVKDGNQQFVGQAISLGCQQVIGQVPSGIKIVPMGYRIASINQVGQTMVQPQVRPAHTVFYVQQPLNTNSGQSANFPDAQEVRRLDGIRMKPAQENERDEQVEGSSCLNSSDSTYAGNSHQLVGSDEDDPTFGFSARPSVRGLVSSCINAANNRNELNNCVVEKGDNYVVAKAKNIIISGAQTISRMSGSGSQQVPVEGLTSTSQSMSNLKGFLMSNQNIGLKTANVTTISGNNVAKNTSNKKNNNGMLKGFKDIISTIFL